MQNPPSTVELLLQEAGLDRGTGQNSGDGDGAIRRVDMQLVTVPTDFEFDPAESMRYNERTVAQRTNARLKDEFGGNHIWVKGNARVMSHLMFGLLVPTVDQLMRLLQ